MAPPANIFDASHSVFLAELIKAEPVSKDGFHTGGQIRVIKIYKAHDQSKIKQITTMSSSTRYGQVQPLTKGSLFLFYNSPRLAPCTFGSGVVTNDYIQGFEKQHQPIWTESKNH